MSLHTLMSQINLVFQFLILAVIIASLLLERRNNYVWHGYTMLTALALNAISFFIVMGPSIQDIVDQPFGAISILSLLHGSLGGIAEIIGIYVVAAWATGWTATRYCERKKNMMTLTLSLWIAAWFLGILLYIFRIVLDI